MKTNIKRGVFVALIAVALLAVCSLLLVACEQDKTVTGITLDTRNAQTDFLLDDEFSPLGLGVVVNYEDGSSTLKLASDDDVQILEPSLDTIGRKNVAVQYGGFTAEYYIDVYRFDDIELDLSEVKRGYTVGDELTTVGLTVFAKLTTLNELNKEVSSFRALNVSTYTVDAPDLSAPGKKTVTISYTYEEEEYVKSFDVYAMPSVTSSILNFEGDGSLSLYVTDVNGGGSADADAQVQGWYLLVRNDGTFDMYETSMSYTATDGSDEFEGTANTTVSGNNLVVSVGGKNYSINIAYYRTIVLGWAKKIVEVRVELPAESKEYLAGATFKSDGLKAFALYSDYSVEEVDSSNASVQAPSQDSMNSVGVKTVNGVYTCEDGEIPFSYQIYCIPNVNWDTNKLDLGYDVYGSGSTLELFVTERSARAENGAYWGTSDQRVKGWLLVKNADGTYGMYEFDYYLGWDVSSRFYPDNNAPEGVNAYLDGDPMVIEINGKKFVAWDVNNWHLKVIGWQ